MSTSHYVQYGLAELPRIEDGLITDRRIFDVTLKAEHGHIVLHYGQRDAPHLDYIAVTEDCAVEIVLHGSQLYFSRDLDAITTKDPLSSFYAGVEYHGYEAALDRYKMIRFRARFNHGGKYGTRHGFNINVDLLQTADDGTPRWITLTIDPDIKNPPPHNS